MDIPDYMTSKELRLATLDDEHLGRLSEYVLYGQLLMKAVMQKELQLY